MVRWQLLSRLDSTQTQAVFDRMYALYEASFPDDSEREPRDVWEAALDGQAKCYRLEFFVALDGEQVAGGVAFEYYPDSRCGLVTFVFVDPSRRREGLATELLSRVEARLKETSGGALRYVFAEAEDPERAAALGVATAIDPAVRLSILSRLGARAVDVTYVQPALAPGKRPAHHLRLLVIFPRHALAVSRSDLRAFLIPFYGSLIPDPAEAAALADEVVASSEADPIPLLPLV
ncbi:MAG TPA: GNAT family N-acetyltransferase [Rhodothermales bacterium]